MTELETSSNEEMLLNLAEELQTENEELRDQIQQILSEEQELKLLIGELQAENKQFQGQIQQILSENSKLKKLLQAKSEQIVKMKESDLELKKSEELRKEAEQKLQDSVALKQIAEAMEGAADKKAQEAARKIEQQDTIIAEEVRRKIQIRFRENAQELHRATLKAKSAYSIPAYAFGLYSAVITLIWLLGQWNILKTTPTWFVNRWENIRTISAAIGSAFMWLHDQIPVSWTESLQYGIPSIVAGLLLYFGIYKGLFKGVICRFKRINGEKWKKYTEEGEKDRRTAFTAFWCAVSLSLSILICTYWKECPLHFLTWYLIFSTASYIIYHSKNKA